MMDGLIFTEHNNSISHVQHFRESKETEERLKKGEWSHEAMNVLLDAYESKWNSRNRGNLRVGDWDDVAKQVSLRGDSLKQAKTPSQCKNKIEGMKKKYRSEALECCNNVGGSAWPFFSRMDALLRSPSRLAGIPGGLDAGDQPMVTDFQDIVPHMDSGDSKYGRAAAFCHDSILRKEVSFSHFQQLFQGTHNFQGQAFLREEEGEEEEEDIEEGLRDVQSNQGDVSNTVPIGKESKTLDSDIGNKAVPDCVSGKHTAKQRRQIDSEVAASIRTFADSILKLEQAKMEMYRDTELLRAAAEAKRAELELRRTEMIMSTQLQIARLLSKNPRKRKKSKIVTASQSKPPEVATISQVMNKYVQGCSKSENANIREAPANE